MRSGLLRCRLLNRRLSLRRIRQVLSGIDVESEAVTCTGLGERPLDGAVDIEAGDSLKRDGLVAGVHYWEVLDMLESFDGDSSLYPTASSIGEVVTTVMSLIDSVTGIREVGLYHLPRPCPRKVSEVAFLFNVLVAIDADERFENRVFLHSD